MATIAGKPDRPRRARTAVHGKLAGLLLILVVTGLTQARVLAAPSEAIRIEAERLRTSGQTSDYSFDILVPDAVPEIYEHHRFLPFWSDRQRVSTLIEALRASADEGLSPLHYHLSRIERLPMAAPGGDPAATDRRDAIADILLTDSLARLVLDLEFGKVAPADRSDAEERIAAVERVITAPDLSTALNSVLPHSSQYQGLRRALATYRRISQGGGWPVIQDGPTIRPGDRDPRLPTIAQRLAASGDFADEQRGEDYGPGLQDAVRRFQAGHGLAVDGVIGPATLRAMTVTVDARIDQIRANLERLRWQRGPQPDPVVLVNIPAFEAYLIRGGVPELTSRVIVGKPKTPTPTFESELKYLVLNPTWTVPRSIASNEMLPTIRNDPAYLARFGYLLLDHSGSPVDPGDVNWAAQSRNNFAYTLVQQPGPANQLGRIKFMMPNEYAVFMHDTPSVNLFNLASRAFSHGCIRVQDPFELATALMRDTGLDGEPLESRVAAGDTQTVFFAKPVAIRIVYHTANSDGGQNVRFFDDVYDLDKELLKALDAGR